MAIIALHGPVIEISDGSQVFPNARYVIGEQEWAYWMKPDIKLGNLLPEEFKQLIVEGAKRHLCGIKERVEFVKPGQEVVTGITAVEAFGHTPGMLAFNISSGSESLFYSADALHHFALSPQRCASRVACRIR